MAFLEITKPEDKSGQKFDVSGDQLTLGRVEGNDCLLEDAAASSHHCVIKKSGDQYTITDLDSTNGTLVNGMSIREIRLNPKDVITIGSLELLFDGADIEPDTSREIQSPPMGGGVNTVVLSGQATGGKPPASFAVRRDTKNVWLITGIVAGIAIAAAIGWFVIAVFK